jgi:hypothetical protein
VERRRRLRGGRRRGISRPWIWPREKRARKFHRSRASSVAGQFLARELRLGLAAKERNPSAFRQSQGRESEMVGRGLAPHPGAGIKQAKMAQLGLAGRSEPKSNTPYRSLRRLHPMGARSNCRGRCETGTAHRWTPDLFEVAIPSLFLPYRGCVDGDPDCCWRQSNDTTGRTFTITEQLTRLLF